MGLCCSLKDQTQLSELTKEVTDRGSKFSASTIKKDEYRDQVQTILNFWNVKSK